MRSPADVAAMQCPVCQVPLSMSDRQGIEIDYCPQCRGVWLDRGELDKIIERSAPAATPPPPVQSSGGHQPRVSDSYGQGHSDYRMPYYKKQKHWLSDIFD